MKPPTRSVFNLSFRKGGQFFVVGSTSSPGHRWISSSSRRCGLRGAGGTFRGIDHDEGTCKFIYTYVYFIHLHIYICIHYLHINYLYTCIYLCKIRVYIYIHIYTYLHLYIFIHNRYTSCHLTELFQVLGWRGFWRLLSRQVVFHPSTMDCGSALLSCECHELVGQGTGWRCCYVKFVFCFPVQLLILCTSENVDLSFWRTTFWVVLAGTCHIGFQCLHAFKGWIDSNCEVTVVISDDNVMDIRISPPCAKLPNRGTLKKDAQLYNYLSEESWEQLPQPKTSFMFVIFKTPIFGRGLKVTNSHQEASSTPDICGWK